MSEIRFGANINFPYVKKSEELPSVTPQKEESNTPSVEDKKKKNEKN